MSASGRGAGGRRKLVAGNWKMHKTVEESLKLASELVHLLSQVRDCDLVVAPSFVALHAVAKRLAGTNIRVAGQDLFYEDEGAYTGAVSGSMLKAAGCEFVLVGHSERRQHFGETLASSRMRVAAALRAQLVPILCVGETLAERESGRTGEVVAAQLDAALEGLAEPSLLQVVIAYEPVWAIGTGKVATPAQAQEVHDLIRERLRSRSVAVSQTARILYGGSVKPDNAAVLMAQPDIDGALVGGASLKAADFQAIARGAKA